LLAKKTEEAKDTATQLIEEINSGKVDPKLELFNQGMFELAPKEAPKEAHPDEAPRYAPALCWKPQRVALDVLLSRQLIRKLDAEKGVTTNPTIPAIPQPAQPEQAPAEPTEPQDAAPAPKPNQDVVMEEGGGEKKEEGAAEPAVDPAAAKQSIPDASVDVDEVVVDESNLQESLAKLDMQLTWLWRVHGVDYYSGASCAVLRG
jgi:hypothetical protein